MNRHDLHNRIYYTFPTKYPEGYLTEELKELLKEFPGINMSKVDDALMGITVMNIDTQNPKTYVIYHTDVERAILCGLENKGLKQHEWD